MKKTAGFTLLEILLVLLLIGMIAAISSLGLVRIVSGFLFASQNSTTAAKAQVAMQRLNKEITLIDTVTNGEAANLVFTAKREGGTLFSCTVCRPPGSDKLLLNNDILVDQVRDFSLAYGLNYDDPHPATSWSSGTKIIQISLTLRGAGGSDSTFVSRISPRNLD